MGHTSLGLREWRPARIAAAVAVTAERSDTSTRLAGVYAATTLGRCAMKEPASVVMVTTPPAVRNRSWTARVNAASCAASASWPTDDDSI